MATPHKLTFRQGYEDAKQDYINGEYGSDFTGLPTEYVRGYVAGQRECLMREHTILKRLKG